MARSDWMQSMVLGDLHRLDQMSREEITEHVDTVLQLCWPSLSVLLIASYGLQRLDVLTTTITHQTVPRQRGTDKGNHARLVRLQRRR